MMAGEDTVPREGSYRQFFDNKRMVAFRYIIKPNFDSSIEPGKRDLTAARGSYRTSTVQGGRRVRGAIGIGRRSDTRECVRS